MKAFAFIIAFFILLMPDVISAQDKPVREKYGKTLNLSAGIGYFGYVGHALPFGSVNYEFDLARNITLAPFVGIYSYRNYYYWNNNGNGNSLYRKYSYRETAFPVGVKAAYYFDELFSANEKWDFYAAGSFGFVFKSVVWESGYNGDKYAYKSASPLYLDGHIGAEYHINYKTGFFLDLSSGVSTLGLAVHF